MSLVQVALTSLLLLVAACLEVGGDALVRIALKNSVGMAQVGFVALGGVVLLAYGIFVNIAPADFGRLLGIYVVLFFVVAQVVNLMVFGVRPSGAIILGGLFITLGGVVLALWKG